MTKESNTAGWIRENFHFTSLLKPMIYAVIFAVIYNLGYLWISGFPSGIVTNALSVLWLCLYGLSWYFVATLAFGRKRATLTPLKVIVVLLWFLAWNIFAMYIVIPLYNFAGASGAGSFLMILIQLLAAFGLICMIPSSILFFRGLYENETDITTLLQSIITSMRAHASAIFNSWLILFLIMIVWDTLFSGPLTIYFGFNAAHLFMELLFLGNPMGFWMLLLSAAGGGISGGYIYAVVLNIISGLILTFLDVNLIVYIGRRYEAVHVSQTASGKPGKKSAGSAKKSSSTTASKKVSK